MLIDISGNSFSILGISNAQDVDATAFITAASITSPTQIFAIDNLVKDLKINNLWNKIKALYPIVGGNATSHSYNLKDPRNLDAAYRLSFTAGWTHDANGMTPNGTSSYANTFFNPLSALSVSSGHIAAYCRVNLPTGGIDIAVATGAGSEPINQLNLLTTGLTPTQTRFTWGTQGAGTIALITATTATTGFFVGSQNGATAASRNVFRNGVKGISATNYGTPSMPNANFFLGALNNPNATPNGLFFTSRPFSFVSFGDGLTDSEVATYYTIVETYQTTLGRQVIQSTTIVRPTEFTLPTVTYNPKQLYGNDLYVWVDMTDWRNMYNTVTGNTNIASTGCVALTGASDTNPNHTNVRRLEDMAGNFTGSNNSRKFYLYGQAGPNKNTAPPSDSTTTGLTHLFANNQLDTNKGIFSGSNSFIHQLSMDNPRNFLATNSALTICSYMPQNVIANANGGAFGICINYYLGTTYLGWSLDGTASNNARFRVPISSTTPGTNGTILFTTTSLTTSVSNGGYFGKTMMLTSVLCGRTFDIYFDNILITSGTLPSAVVYPFSATQGPFVGGGICFSIGVGIFYFGGQQSNRTIWEGFIANSYTSPQQINLLYDYFRVKFKDRTYDLF